MIDWTRYRRFVLPVVTLVIFLVSLIHSFVKTQTLEERIGQQVTTSMWLVSQSESEYLRFLNALERYRRGDDGVDRDDVIKRYEIFWSRIPLLLEGSEARPLREILADDLEGLLRPLLLDLARLEPVLMDLKRGDGSAFREIREALDPYGQVLHRLVIDTHWQKGWRASLYRVRDITLYLEVGPSLAGILFSGALLVVLLIREIRRADGLLRKSQAAEGALTQARNLAERANAAKSRFLVAANHDLRQPLQSIGLYTAALQSADGAGERDKICGEMSGAIETMGNLLDVLLDIDNLEEGRVRIQRVEFPAVHVLRVVEREFRLRAREQGLDLRVVPSSLLLRSDPLLLQRIVQNFVANAISYTRDGKVLVGCRPHGGAARLEVWDSGVGVARDQLKSIFEDYYQVDNPARNRQRGLGLGLAIAQRIARLLNHQIIVRSRLGRGSMFAVEVPLIGRVAALDKITAEAAAATAVPDFSGAVFVAIDDDESIIDGMRQLLTSWGARAVCGTTVREVFAELERNGCEPDLIIADYRLAAGQTGTGAVQALRESFDRQLPAIIITGDTSASVTRLIQASGCTIVHKPLDSVTLQRLIQEKLDVLGTRRPDDAARREAAGGDAGGNVGLERV